SSFLLLSFSIILPYLIVDLKLCNRTLLDLNTILAKIIEMIDELNNDEETDKEKKKNIELIYEDLSDFIKEQDIVHTFYKQIKKHLN
ncbi:hypothetical protein P7H56_09475, partial [Vagococcus lutrae]|uniref:hypothetical protein n=1 Tax=Vagococcus lutrae TaxID=81947 RepID=UPI00289125A2